jgi:hypothetical protein
MPAANKFNKTVQAFVNGGNLNLTTDTQKLMLTNTVPVASNNLYSDVSGTELAAGSGYSTGGATISSPTSVNTSGTQSVGGTVANPTWTSSGSMGPFRYVIYYDTTTGQLLAWWDYGSSVTLTSGQTFTVSVASGLMTIQ